MIRVLSIKIVSRQITHSAKFEVYLMYPIYGIIKEQLLSNDLEFDMETTELFCLSLYETWKLKLAFVNSGQRNRNFSYNEGKNMRSQLTEYGRGDFSTLIP